MEIIGMELSQIRGILNSLEVGESYRKSPKNTTKTEEPLPSEKKPMVEILGRQKENIKNLAENLNKFMQSINYNLQFIPDREEGTIIIKVFDKEGHLIRQIPPEAFLTLSSRIGEHIGVLINSKL